MQKIVNLGLMWLKARSHERQSREKIAEVSAADLNLHRVWSNEVFQVGCTVFPAGMRQKQNKVPLET